MAFTFKQKKYVSKKDFINALFHPLISAVSGQSATGSVMLILMVSGATNYLNRL